MELNLNLPGASRTSARCWGTMCCSRPSSGISTQGASKPLVASLTILNKACLEKGIVSLSSLGKETVRGLMVHAMVEVMILTTLLQVSVIMLNVDGPCHFCLVFLVTL